MAANSSIDREGGRTGIAMARRRADHRRRRRIDPPGRGADLAWKNWRASLPVIENCASHPGAYFDRHFESRGRARRGSRGAAIINDVTGGRGDPEMMRSRRKRKRRHHHAHAGHAATMQRIPHYDDVVGEVADFFRQQYARALECGIDPMAIAFDPGIGFGKTLEHNLELLAQS
jgi:dihydropteroate synthase